MNRKILTLSSVAALLVGSNFAIAQQALPGSIEIPSGNNGYPNSDGFAIRTGLGECLKLTSFSEDNQVNACEGIEDEAVVEDTSPEPEPAPAPAPIPREPIVTTASIGGEALFDSNSATLNADSEQALADLVAQLESFQEISLIVVTGHSDSVGAEAYNQQLSESRAEAVRDFLSAAYPDVSISSRGLGESSPIATNSTPEGRQLNRRVEIQVTAKTITE